jgi:hypothetical protein
MISAKTKAKLGTKVAGMLTHPSLRWASWNVGKLVARHRLPDQFRQLGGAARNAGAVAVTYGPLVARLVVAPEPPKKRRTGPAVLAGMVIGAGAVYFLEPEHGSVRRRRVMARVSSQGADAAPQS